MQPVASFVFLRAAITLTLALQVITLTLALQWLLDSWVVFFNSRVFYLRVGFYSRVDFTPGRILLPGRFYSRVGFYSRVDFTRG